MAYINVQGGSSQQLTNVAKNIWELALNNNITISAKFLAGKDNIQADYLSRLSPQYEWQLHPNMWRYIDCSWGPHTIDRFATMLNTQLSVYNSRFMDPFSAGIDALAQADWGEHNNYVNAPFRLLPQVIDTVLTQKAVATVIAPWWPGQTWTRKLLEMSTEPPIHIPNLRQTFIATSVMPEPRKNYRWKLYAWRISGQVD